MTTTMEFEQLRAAARRLSRAEQAALIADVAAALAASPTPAADGPDDASAALAEFLALADDPAVQQPASTPSAELVSAMRR